ncbi:unnamed protein product [Dovyalis caffra]|uniref:Uncharacterized protein n=1 Tax=Dovyalis caffra TaxID=77055 RepID=A0AAV1SA63_9ROSI|nr:unnamed protein product [Dovyalis caffra]
MFGIPEDNLLYYSAYNFFAKQGGAFPSLKSRSVGIGLAFHSHPCQVVRVFSIKGAGGNIRESLSAAAGIKKRGAGVSKDSLGMMDDGMTNVEDGWMKDGCFQPFRDTEIHHPKEKEQD